MRRGGDAVVVRRGDAVVVRLGGDAVGQSHINGRNERWDMRVKENSDEPDSRHKASSRVEDCPYTYILPKDHVTTQCGTLIDGEWIGQKKEEKEMRYVMEIKRDRGKN